jgi:predicted dehydrogenase
MTLAIGLLGAGAMGAEHAFSWADVEGAKVAAVFSRDLARARAVAEPLGARAVDDPGSILADEAIEAVDVCVPTPAHGAYVIPALEAGKHVFCETPLALAMDEALAVRAAARKTGRLLQVGLLMRSVGPYALIEQKARSGEHGPLLSLTCWRLGSYLRPGASDHKPHYGDPTTELITFDFDFALWLKGRPARIAASGRLDGEVQALLAWPDGATAAILATGMAQAAEPFRAGFRALFENAAFELANVFSGEGPPASTFTMATADAPPAPAAAPDPNPYAAELARFAACVRGEADAALLDVDRAIEALELSLAIRRELGPSRDH